MSQPVHNVNCPYLDEIPVSSWNVYNDQEKESDQEAEALESQSQDQHSHSLPPAQHSSPRDEHMTEVEQGFLYSQESFNYIQDLFSEANHQANTCQVLGQFSGWTPNVQQVQGHKLRMVGEEMLQDWYQPSQHTIWSDAEVSSKIYNLQLAPKQQALLKSDIHLNVLG